MTPQGPAVSQSPYLDGRDKAAQLHPSFFTGCWKMTGSWALRAAGSNVALKPHLEAFHRGDFGRQGPALGSRWVSSCSHLSSSSLNKSKTRLWMEGRTSRGKYISAGGFACVFPCWKSARIILHARTQEAGVLSKGRVERSQAFSKQPHGRGVRPVPGKAAQPWPLLISSACSRVPGLGRCAGVCVTLSKVRQHRK